MNYWSLGTILLPPGVAVVTAQGAFLWTDGRYHLQASQQVNSDLWTLMNQGVHMVGL